MRVQDLKSEYFVYDLEFIGNVKTPSTCRIWDICVMHVNSMECFGCVVNPDNNKEEIPPPVVEGLFPLTRKFLSDRQATNFSTVWNRLTTWVIARSKDRTPVLISHNNFSSDKLVLEHHFLIHSIRAPLDWYFFDSLHFFRDTVRTNGYSLKALVSLILNEHDWIAHRAYQDTVKLYECIDSITNGTWNLTGQAYPLYIQSLRTIYGIGPATETILLDIGITDKGTLLNRISGMANHSCLIGKLPTFVPNVYLWQILKERNIPYDVSCGIVNECMRLLG